MTTREIAGKLVDYVRKGKYEEAQKELYAENAVSYEQQASPAFDKETKGLRAIIEKGHRFGEMVEETHSTDVTDPIIAGNAITFGLDLDVTMKGQGRSNMKEICTYVVKDGKIAEEHFFM